MFHAPLTSKSKLNLKSDRVNLVAPASPIECLLYLPNVRAIEYKLGPERLTRLGNSNVLRLPVVRFTTVPFKALNKGLFPIVDFSLKDLWISATEAMVELVRIKLFQARKGIELSDHIKVLL